MNTSAPIDGSGKGYIRVHRKLLEHPLFKNKPPAWLKIWLYILLRANWRESVFRPRQGESIVVPAGSLITSLEKLGTHAALSKEHARLCLDYLERTHSVTLQRTHHWTMITIVNWAAYQQADDDAHHAEHYAEYQREVDDATRETPHQTPRTATPSKEVKNLSKKYTSNSSELDTAAARRSSKPQPTNSRESVEIDQAVREWFEVEFWPIYPRREGKQSALKAANAKATTPEKRAFYLGRLKSQLPAYLQRKGASGQQVVPMAATWFNQDRSDDELDLSPGPNKSSLRAAENDYPEYVPLSRLQGNSA
jgi:hypothetical protein